MFHSMFNKAWIVYILFFNIVLSSEFRGKTQDDFSSVFEVGPGIGYFMPRTDFFNSHEFSIGGLWTLSPSYGIRFSILHTQLNHESSDSSHHFLQFGPGVEFSLQTREKVKGYTLIDVGFIDGKKDALFIFGIGMKYRMNEKYSLKFELRDYHEGIGIPFVTFPRSKAGVSGKGGSKYLDFQVQLHYRIK